MHQLSKRVFLALIGVSTLAISGIYFYIQQSQIANSQIAQMSLGVKEQVLGVADSIENMIFRVAIPARFEDSVSFTKPISAPNLIESLQAGDGIRITNGAIPVITNEGILELQAGTGISIDGNKITSTITQGYTSLTAGTNISVDGNKITNTYTAPTIDYALSGWTDNGTTITLTTTTDSVTLGSLTTGAITAGSLTTSGLALAGGLTVTSGNSLLPDTDLGSDIGSAGYRFNNLWVANINSNSSQAFSGQSTFSYAPTSTAITQASLIINPTTSFADGQLLGLGIGGYQRALIDEDGDITLGYNSLTSAPASDYPLNIYGHSGTRVASVDTSGNLAIGTGLTSTGALTITPNAGSNLNIGLSTTGDFAINSNQLYVDTSTGYVGVGTTSPVDFLTVSPSSYYGITLTESDSNNPAIKMYSGSLSGTLSVYYNNTVYARIDGYGSSNSWLALGSAQNLGIGTATPTSKLHVTGAVTGKALAIFDETGNQDILVASASGTNRFVITSSGSMGLGTTAPGEKVEVVDGRIKTSGSSSSWSTINGVEFNDTYGGASARRWSISSSFGSLAFTVGTTQLGNPWSSGALKMIVDSSGNVGIGISAPTSKLHVNGAVTGKALAIFDETGNQALMTASASGVTKFIVDHSGNVGIGTATSDYPLVVNGTVAPLSNVTGALGTGSRYWANSYIYGVNFGGGSATQIQGVVGIADYNLSVYAGIGRILNLGSNGVTNQMVINAGNVGIGTTTPTSKLHVSGAVTGKALAIFDETGNQNILVASASGTTKMVLTNAGKIGLGGVTAPDSTLQIGGNISTNDSWLKAEGTLNGGYANGIYISGVRGTSGNESFAVNAALRLSGTAAGGVHGAGLFRGIAQGTLVGTMIGSQHGIEVWTAGNTLTDGYAIKIKNPVNAGTITNNYGLYIENQTSGATNYSIYSAGGNNYLGGNLGIGTASPSVMLDVVADNASTNATTNVLNLRHSTTGTAAANLGVGINSELELPDGTIFTGGSISNVMTDTSLSGSTAWVLSARDRGAAATAMKITAAGYLYLGGSTASYIGYPSANVINVVSNNYSNLQMADAGTTVNADGRSKYFSILGLSNTNALYVSSGANVGIGTTTFGTSAAKVLAIAGSTAPTTAITDGIQLYAVDAAGSHELKVMDEAGNATTLSPHNFSLIESGPSEEMAWSYYSERDGLGVNVDMTKALRIVESLSGEKLIFMKELESGVSTDPAISTSSAVVATKDFYLLKNIVETITQAIADIQAKILAFADKFRTKELCLGDEGAETCVTKTQLDELIKMIPSPSPSVLPSTSPSPTLSPSPEATFSATVSASI